MKSSIKDLLIFIKFVNRLSKVTGTISVDGVTPLEAGLAAWRSRLVALPQRPALFAATLRDNLDPDEIHSDAEIWDALEQVCGTLRYFMQVKKPILEAALPLTHRNNVMYAIKKY